MTNKELIKDIEMQLQALNISYRRKRKADFEIFSDKKDEEDEDNLLYLGLLFIKEKEKIINIFEKNVNSSNLRIMDVIQSIANNHGYTVQSVIEKKEASYPIYIALPFIILIFIKDFFNQSIKTIAQWIDSFKHWFQKQDKKSKLRNGMLIIFISVIMIILIIILVSRPKDNEETIDPPIDETQDPDSNQPPIDPPVEEEPLENSSRVSLGVNANELGNIASGQFYFETQDDIFYSCYDEENNAHIYRVDKDTNAINKIFDGFGWSLVVFNDKLYFSGNSGSKIDGTYHLYRMNLDGTQLEKLVPSYTYNMFFYGNHLYYVKLNGSLLDIYRMDLTTLLEERIIDNGKLPVIYNHKLYYVDNLGNLFRSDPNGQNKEVLAYLVSFFVISNNKVIYYDVEYDLYHADLDGKNQTLVHQTSQNVFSFSVSNNTIFFIEYKDYDSFTGERTYTIYSINLDGTNYKEIMTLKTYLLYSNVINQQVFAFIYTMQTIYIETFSFDGIKLLRLDR